MTYSTKDSGNHKEYSSGMKRDIQDGKARWDLLLAQNVPYESQFLTRVAELLERGSRKYDARNWEKASTQEELDRMYASGLRHMMQYIAGETDEDHAAAVVANLLFAETTKWKMENEAVQVSDTDSGRSEASDSGDSHECTSGPTGPGQACHCLACGNPGGCEPKLQ